MLGGCYIKHKHWQQLCSENDEAGTINTVTMMVTVVTVVVVQVVVNGCPLESTVTVWLPFFVIIWLQV